MSIAPTTSTTFNPFIEEVRHADKKECENVEAKIDGSRQGAMQHQVEELAAMRKITTRLLPHDEEVVKIDKGRFRCWMEDQHWRERCVAPQPNKRWNIHTYIHTYIHTRCIRITTTDDGQVQYRMSINMYFYIV